MASKKKAAKQRGSWRRWALPVAFLALIMTPFLVVFSIEEKTTAAWEEFLARWRSHGESFELQHLLPPPLPDSENVALHPALASFLERQDPDLDWRQSLPGDLPGWNEQAYLRYLRDLSEGNVTNIFASFGLEPCAPADFRAHLGKAFKDWGAVLDRYGQAVRERTLLAFEVDWVRLFLDEELPHFAAYSNLGKAFLARAAIRRALGEAKGSQQDLATAMHLARSYDRVPLLLCQLLQTGLLSSILDEIRAGLTDKFFGPSELREIAALLEQAPALPANYLAGLRFERALILDFFATVEASHRAEIFPHSDPGSRGGVIRHLLNRRWMDASRLALCKDQQELFLGTGARLADVERWHSALSLRLADGWEHFIAPLGHEALVSTRMGSSLARPLFTADSMLHGTRLAVALTRYRAELGRCPFLLSDLLPTYLPSLPELDPSVELDYQIMENGAWHLSVRVLGKDLGGWEGRP